MVPACDTRQWPSWVASHAVGFATAAPRASSPHTSRRRASGGVVLLYHGPPSDGAVAPGSRQCLFDFGVRTADFGFGSQPSHPSPSGAQTCINGQAD